MRKIIEGEEGVSQIGDIEQLEQFLNNIPNGDRSNKNFISSMVQNKTRNPLKCFERLALRFNKNKTKHLRGPVGGMGGGGGSG